MDKTSIIDLKAELYSREKDLKNYSADKRCNEEVLIPKKTFDKIASITGQKTTNKEEDTRAREPEKLEPIKTEEDIEYENKLNISSSILNKKAQIYEDLQKKGINHVDTFGETVYLVDFENKKCQSKGSSHAERMVEIVDEYGAKKTVSINKYKEILKKNPNTKIINNSFYEELLLNQPKDAFQAEKLHLDYQKRKWEEADKLKRDSDNQDIHYQDVFYDELRELGVGHYKFSQNSMERAAQMELLNSLRQKTIEQREKLAVNKDAELIKKQKRLDALKKLRFGDSTQIKATKPIIDDKITSSQDVENTETSDSSTMADYISDEIKKMRKPTL